MTDPFELKRAAIRLRDRYRDLNEIKMTPPRSPAARKTKPTFGPQSPNPDGDWAFNIEHLLVNECDDDNPNAEAPSGLFNMVVDAQRYIHNKTGPKTAIASRTSSLCTTARSPTSSRLPTTSWSSSSSRPPTLPTTSTSASAHHPRGQKHDTTPQSSAHYSRNKG